MAPVIHVRGENKSEEFVLDCVRKELLDTYIPEQLEEPVKEIAVVGYTTVPQDTSYKLDYVCWDENHKAPVAHIENTDTFIGFDIGLFDVEYVGEEFQEKPKEQIVKLLFIKNDLDIERDSQGNESKYLPYRMFHKSIHFPQDKSLKEILDEIRNTEKAFSGYNILVTFDDKIDQPILIRANTR